MENKLTNNDVLELLNSKDSEARVMVAQKICSEYLTANYNADELKIAEEIFRLAIRDAELKIRITISEALKEAEQLPHDIAIALAKDVEDVANPMIQYSPVLTDEDLLEIIQSSSIQKIIAISRRKKLTKKLVEQLLKQPSKDVLENIIGNSEFANTDAGFEGILTSIATNRDAVKNLIQSISLPPKLTETMMNNVAQKMIDEVKKKYDFTPGLLDRVAGHTIELSTLTIINEKSDPKEVDALIEHLHDFGRLTTSLIISSLCICKLRFFVSAISKRSGKSKEMVRKTIEKNDASLVKLLDSAAMPEKLHKAIQVVLQFILDKMIEDPKITTKECSIQLIEKLEYYNDRGKIEYLNYLLAIAKQNLKTQIFS